MKIAFYHSTGRIGGAEMCLLDLLAALRGGRPSWQSGVVLGEDGPLRAAVEALGVPCAVLPLPATLAGLGDAALAGGGRGGGWPGLAARAPGAALAAAGYLRRLRRALAAERPDRVQTGAMKAHALAAWAAPPGVPLVWHVHDYVGSRPVMARLLRLAARTARRPIAAVGVSRSVAEDAGRSLGDLVAVRAIPNAIDLEAFAPGPGDGAALDAAAGLPPAPAGVVRVGLVATFAFWKGHDVFLEAAARVAAERPGACRFYVVGGPIYRSAGSQRRLDELTARAAALGLAGRVGFTGHVADPAAALRALDVVVHASTRPEPFGRVIVEGMACGRAVVAAPAGGAAELIEDGVTALASPPGDPAALAAALGRLAADPALRHRLGEAGRRAARAHFDRARLADEWADVFEAAAPRGPAAGAAEGRRDEGAFSRVIIQGGGRQPR